MSDNLTRIDNVAGGLLEDVRALIVEAKSNAIRSVNTLQTMLYWEIGSRINEEALKGERGEYGKQIIIGLSNRLTAEFGRGFSDKNLRRMLQFAETFPEKEIVAALMRQLSWTHFTLLIPLKSDLEKDFYTQMARLEGWSVRVLRKKIDSMLFERTALSKKPEELIRKEINDMAEKNEVPDSVVLKDPYVLDFLDLKDTHSEKDLEAAILHELEKFILEFGAGFSFVERQKRMIIDGEDHYLDLLFYHRRLQRLIAIELKIGKFKASYKGQIELYLRWLEKNEVLEGELPPLGLILCAGKSEETIELLQLDKTGVHVAEYMTELPERKVLEQKLHHAIETAKVKIANLSDGNTDTESEEIIGGHNE